MSVKPAFWISTIILLLIFLIKIRVGLAYTFPIPELGNCQNQKECHLYCEIPKNQPACWSYRVYKTAVLGETSIGEALTQLGFTFPIPELGSCASRTECKEYCQDPTNMIACQSFSQNIRQIVNQRLLEKAQAELGCTTKEDCRTLCSEEQNKSLCASFSRKWKIKTRVKTTVLNQARTALGCQTLAECKTMCEDPVNKVSCQNFAKQSGLKVRMSLKEKLGCTTDDDCRKLCAADPNQCPGYPNLPSPAVKLKRTNSPFRLRTTNQLKTETETEDETEIEDDPADDGEQNVDTGDNLDEEAGTEPETNSTTQF